MQRVDDGMRGGGRVGVRPALTAAVPPRSRKTADTERDNPMEADIMAAHGTNTADTEIRPSLPAPALRFDWTDWLPYLEDQDIPDEQKRVLIETLWAIVVSFVDLGWQITPKAEFSGEALDLKAILTDAAHGNGKEAE